MKITNKFVFFWGGIYSQWFLSKFSIDGIEFHSAEQYMMWSKAVLFKDTEIAEKILSTKNPSIQKQLGRKVRGFNNIEWTKVCRGIVYDGNYAKFDQNDDLRDELLSTGDRVIVEASPSDRIWGVGLHETDPLILDPKNWRGTNWLGIEIMNVRDNLK